MLQVILVWFEMGLTYPLLASVLYMTLGIEHSLGSFCSLQHIVFFPLLFSRMLHF